MKPKGKFFKSESINNYLSRQPGIWEVCEVLGEQQTVRAKYRIMALQRNKYRIYDIAKEKDTLVES